jgi:Protein of unknown function (DUF1688)
MNAPESDHGFGRELAPFRSPSPIPARAHELYALAEAGALAHFTLNPAALDVVASEVAALTRARFPDLVVPVHGRMLHFGAGGVDRAAALRAALAGENARERARALVDVVVVSVLLDAGAGMAWRYREGSLSIGRSEGLAVASLAWVAAGGLSSRGRPYEVDALGLARVSEASLAAAFQVRDDNPLVGVGGRVHLLRALGEALRARPDVFGSDSRIGGLVDKLAADHPSGALPAADLLALLLDALAPIWPGRLALHGAPLGDVWRHPQAGGEGATRGLVPFHKLSQWLSYSLFEPLAEAGLCVVEPDALTGLAEYRNGGLFLDLGVLLPKDPDLLTRSHAPDALAVVEWRALTVALLDALLPRVRGALGKPELPLAVMLEGGTWALGRKLAAERRPDGGPPLHIISDGTVF